MNSYNGKQITQMRWQDVKELEKFKFISDEFSFVSEVLEEASSNVQPAFIRYSAGNVIIQLQNGSIAPVKTITDIVTTI